MFQYFPVCLDPAATQCSVVEFPSLYVALGASLVTLLYSILTFASNDRLSGKRRRVILPAHLMQILWYTCMMASRMLSIVLFATVYHYFVFAFLGGHWLIMFVFLLIQRTTFCADVIKESNSEVRVKRRWCLELPFDFVAATMYIFAFFVFRRGKTRYWALFYHLLMYAEIVAMSVVFFIQTFTLPHYFTFSVTSLTLALGLYPVGMLFLLTYYLFFHPNKTGSCYWIGLPKLHSHRGSGSVGERGFRNRTPGPDGRVDISGPTLVAHNGFIPRDMLPSDVPSSPGHEQRIATNPADVIAQSQMSSEQREPDWLVPRSQGASAGRSYLNSLTIVSPTSTGKSTTVPSETFPILSDGQSLVGPSDVDTDISSTVLHVPQGDIKGDTVIDTPLFGNTPDPTQQLKVSTEPASGTLRSLTDTVDTGIDVGTDTPLTQGTNEYNGDVSEYYSRQQEDMSLGMDIDLPQFSDIPAKRNSFIAKKSPLESHYFPDSQSHDSVTPTLPAPSWGYKSPSSTKPLLSQNSSSESGEMYQTRTKNSNHQHHVLPLAISTPERTKRSAPRSPKGARAFTISTGEDGKSAALSRNRVAQTSSYPSRTDAYHHHSPPRQRAPRSPKGARRMMITQDPTKPARPEPAQTNRHSFTNTSFYHSKSPERVPRGVLNYQRMPPANTSAKTPDGRRRNITRPQPVQKSHSMHVPSSMRSPERQPKGATGYRREGPGMQHKQYIQQQQQNRSRWDKWAAEQEEKRRQANSEHTPSYSHSPNHKAEVTQSYPSAQNPRGEVGIPRNASEEFDHLEPMNSSAPHAQQDSVDSGPSILVSASVAPQSYPRAPQGARGTTPRVGWSPARSDHISLSPQRSVHSVPGVSLLHQDSVGLSASARIPKASPPRPQGAADSYRMSQRLSSGSYNNKFYAPTSSTHQSVV